MSCSISNWELFETKAWWQVLCLGTLAWHGSTILSGFSRPLAAVLSIEFPWNRAQKKSDPNAETNGFAILAKLKHLDFDSVAETFRDGSGRYSGHLITCAWPSLNGAPSKRRKNEKSEGNLVTKFSIMASRTIDFPLWIGEDWEHYST